MTAGTVPPAGRLVATAVLAGLLVSGPGPAWPQGGARRTGPQVGMAAGGFELTTLQGEPLRLESFRGRPLVMNFFASWCDPCREEMPLLNALASEPGVRVLGVAVQDGRGAITQYAREARLTFPIALDLNSTVQRAYWVYGPPVTFFIDAGGTIRDKVVGPLSPDRLREALARVAVRR
jgi:cytochrome c biogenesis protein CcmG/thiol:disulfide interchange protein DsbE